jgi:cephalosporin hydroxylase
MQHFYQCLEGWCDYENLYAMMVKHAPSSAHFVEVGSWKGQSAAFMCVEIAHSGKQIRFDCVDTWLGSDEPLHHTDLDCVNGTLYERFIHNMQPVAGLYNPVRMTSTQAAACYDDHSLDFVFLDADHTYASVVADITAWRPKIRPGGYLAGHDFGWTGVKQAVNQLLPQAAPALPHSWLALII